MKIRKFNAIIAFISASLALSSCSFFEKGETPKTPTESTLLAVDDRANSYVVGEIFDNYVTNGGLTPKVRMSDNTEKVLTKTDFTYEIKTAADSIVTGTKPFTTSGNYTVTVSKLKLKPVSYTIRVNPKEEPTPVATLTSISVTGYSDEVYQGDEYVFSGTVTAFYNDDSKKDVTSKADIGTISTETLGEKQLSVSYKEGDVTRQLVLTIKVVEKPAVDVKITSITFSETSKSLVAGNTYTVTTTIAPSNATNKNLTWSSSNSDVAIVSNGLITARAVGNARITATAKDGSNKSAYIDIEVTPVLVTKITLLLTSKTVEVGDTFNLSASITPSNATNKEVEWTTSNSSVATVSGGAVTTVGVGSATITATAKDGSGCKATCSVTVNAKPIKVTSITLSDTSINLIKGSTKALTATVGPSNATNKNLTWKSSNSTVATYNSTTGLVSALKSGTATITATAQDGSGKSASCTVTVTTPVTGISLNKTTLSLSKGASETLTATISPSDATNKKVNWSGSANGITVDSSSGKVTVSSTAIAGKTATIVATSDEDSTIKAQCVVTVSDAPARDAWTLLIYMCGADLESDYADTYDEYGDRMYGCATEDLMEIASVKNQPSDVNVVVQAGGAKKWDSKYSSVINKDKCNRFHLSNKNYVKDSQTSKVNMGLEESLIDFVQWGLETYPADKVGLIFWNHGGGMGGCCFDEQFSNDSLEPYEVASAIPTAISKSGYNQNLEFIGYDCCLMSIQDIAGLNADYANYMVASEESEWGYGWSYDKWIDDLFAKGTTESILKACVDGFAEDTEEAYSYWGESNDQTLAYYSLQNWSNYENAWEDFATYLSSSIIKSSSNWTTFKNVVNKAQKYGYSGEDYYYYNNGYPYDIFDVKDFLNKMKSDSNYKNNSTLMTKVNNILTAFANLNVYSWCGTGAGNSNGLCMFCPISGLSTTSGTYAVDNTCFSAWRQLCIDYGNWRY